MLAALAVQRQCRLLVVVAAAGYGKTTAMRAALPAGRVHWCSGLAELPAAAGESEPDWIVLDDVPRLSPDQTRRLLTSIAELPDSVRIAVLARWPLAAPVSGWRGRGLLAEIDPADLALTPAAVSATLARDHGLDDPVLARQVHQATAGWPALVHLTGQALIDGAAMTAVAAPGTPLASYVEEEVLGPLPATVVRLVRQLSELAPVSASLCRAIGHQGADAALDLLTRTGVIQGNRLVPVVAQVARRTRRSAAADRRHRLAAAWYEDHGPPIAAALTYQRIGELADCARILTARGDEMVVCGAAAQVIELVRALPDALVDRRLQLLLGEALCVDGQAPAALGVLDALAAGADRLEAALAWRMGMVHYLRGEPQTALDTYARAADLDAGSTVDAALLLSWSATAHWMLGAADDGLDCARRACEQAAAAQSPRALAAAHVALALCLTLAGDLAGADEHYAHALRYADAAGDVVQLTRIHLNRSHHLLAEARYPEAVRLAGLAAELAEATGPPGILAIALCNEAEALTRLGRYDEAVERLERVVSLTQRTGSRRVAGALHVLGEVHRRRGAFQQARGVYEEAVRIARDGGERQALVPALAGLARLLAAEDPAAARVLAKEAMDGAVGSGVVPALIAGGWVELARGRPDDAARLAGEAVGRARRRREPSWLAEALELQARLEGDTGKARTALTEAYDIWRTGGACHDADRLLVALGSLPVATTDQRLEAKLAVERLTAAGVAGAGMIDATGNHVTAGGVVVRVLGRFEVFVDERAVPASEWQSRKARDLVRILVARRGRPVPRSELSELLWPDDDSARTAHRLSVLLSIVRTVSGKDVLAIDAASVALDLTQVRVDVEDFLADVAHGIRLRDCGATAAARSLLAAAEQSYLGDAFGDDPYDDWAVALREEARGAYLRTLRALVELDRAAGDTEQAASYLRRLLQNDPYDEAAHRLLVEVLVAGGRHGEARRAFDRYTQAMAGIGVRPPDETVLSPR